MLAFVARRFVVSVFTLLASTLLVYFLVARAGNPLTPLYTDRSAQRDAKIAERIQVMHLDQPLLERWAGWLWRASGCVLPGRACDLGRTADGQDVLALLRLALGSTVRLVLVAAVLAAVLGVAAGVVSALRQYSGVDHAVTFAAFLFFSLPVFWVAVLLKQFLAVEFNDWLVEPHIGLPTSLVLSAVSALTWSALLVGRRDDARRRRWVVRGVAFGSSLAVLQYLSAVEWFRRPGLGAGVVLLLALASAAGAAVLFDGLRRGRLLYACLATAAVGGLVQFGLGPVLRDPSWFTLFLLLVAAWAVGAAIGWVAGAADRARAVRACVLTASMTALWVFTDHVFAAVPAYSRLVNGRLVATIGSGTPNFAGDFWETFLDDATHLLLPTVALMLVSFAGYSRFARAGLLDVLDQDYVRTARAIGLSERAVVVRHALRSALIPVTTVLALDLGTLIGGAVITETVFGWRGMGAFFVEGLALPDPNQVMAFYLVTAVAVVAFTTVADIAYAYLDPRVRL
ncbi:ABC transporter permease subunit [Spongisporangium articulatum]|uniref:ABC transporter permease subunit n=1 Tax=Spongisporangium articulatum TaxID=3362603 RepID=A0ABW8AQ86_9ACTN